MAAVALALLVPTGLAAHSLLLESSPVAGATLSEPPPQISLRFNNRIEKSLSTIRVLDERGATRPVSMRAGEGADRLAATVSDLSPGAWRVEWQVLSTDGHIVSGRFTFRIAPQTAR